MTDTGQVPGEGQPESAGMVEQPGIPAPGAYTFLDPSENAAEDDDLLLMPGSQGAWSEPHAGAAPAPAPMAMPPAPAPEPLAVDPVGAAVIAEQQAQAQHAQSLYEPVAQSQPVVHEPVEQAAPVYEAAPVHEPAAHEAGAHEAGGRDSGSVDLTAVRMQEAAPAAVPEQAVHAQAPAAAAPARRPLHMGPPVPGASGGVVRSLADRGPANPGPAAPGPMTPGPATSGGLEYLDVPREEPASALPGPQLGELPPQSAEPWSQQPQPPQMPQPVPAETVVPEPAPAPAGQFVPVEGSVPTAPHLAPTPPAPEPAPEPVAVAPQPVPVTAPEPEPAPEAAVTVPAPRDGGAPAPVDQAPEQVAPEPVAQPVEAPAEQVAPEQAVTEQPVAAEPAQPQPAEQPEAVQQPGAVPGAEAQAAEPQQPVAAAPVAAEPAAVPVPEQVPAEQVPAEPVAEQAPAELVPAEPVAEQVPAEQPAPVVEQQPEILEADATERPAAEPAPVAPEATAPEAPAPETTAPEATAAEAPAPEATVPEAPAPEATDAEAPAPEATAPAPAYDDVEREAVLRVMRERRDIRNGFRSDPIPHEVLLRVLEAAHTAPSVGHSQPWDFVVIRSAETRRTMHELAQRQREAYAKSLPKGRAKQFKELKIEAILDTPVNIVVTADPTRGGRHTLGRHTQPQMAPYSSALAVENLWLAARAEGLGVGWVSFFDEREMVRALGLPEHLEVVAYLCVGYVDEFPEEPELMQAGWSKRRPLSWVVHEETYGRRALPGEEPHDLLQETVANIRPLDAKALGEAWERQKRMTKPAGALGMLEIISAQLSGLSRVCPPPIPEPAAVAIFAGDHGVHAQGVTAWPQEVTGQMVANFLGGGAVCNAFANQVGAEVCVIDVGVAGDLPATPGLLPRKVRPGTADFTTGPALAHEEVLAAIEVGIETARDLVAAGNKALLTGEMGIANTTASAALISVYTDVDAAEVTGRGTGINDEMHARKVDVVRRGLELHQPDPADPIGVLAAVGGLEHAALVGFILGGASLRTPVVLDGVSAGAAALVARAIAPEALAACIAGHRSAEPGHVAALNKLGLRPLVDLDLRLGEGTGALLALPVIQSAARAMHEVATFDSAGVTEK
ncbi:nicotinate-nucleotide--dimethylbenzimidazole phosphoribosyltransferase [Streptomyces sp. WAC05374]|uniref:nicotinate-nucleotide--dimethylbenzimidazole phosphoribosyltransferase n=2 Tax=Streptomyces sp. WAC05374 TaxID=2487420 RepID=UPI0010569BD3|nr:nicotinate-nucleotide--dimethylbenzimidazole phosphoribosyltransferase [Streptomyces sp. WAC05374]TDF43547.1 nicotinate-nucleotide--dimethylbenzimidazole phosphoribosyltransferase [Streptomyces sp. WAC05374]TDF51551.1 nicotinate-nucleotide--dimethylbenzimidazole phosphoribosyltransferase [Streptomyces sp. WAC05374]TDF53294.1 nicotinate-nucleotide--dimethylbenzimidazole phosphoribosyltransferase [Streptomyces sp. WAC05374]